MKKQRFIAALMTGFFSVVLLFFQQVQAQKTINTISFGENGTVYLEDFEKYKKGSLPNEWYNRDGDRNPANYEGQIRDEYQYYVETENKNRFLRYSGREAKHLNFPLADKEGINIYQTPVFSWRWRVHDIPTGANEDVDDFNDTAASVYVVFDMGRVMFRRVPKSIRYTWSSTQPKGKEMSKFFGNQKIVVLESGEGNTGNWQTIERNIVEDYRRLFGDDPPKTPIAVLILSDGDNTRSFARADYDDFEFRPLN
jgi:hypothetical protein